MIAPKLQMNDTPEMLPNKSYICKSESNNAPCLHLKLK